MVAFVLTRTTGMAVYAILHWKQFAQVEFSKNIKTACAFRANQNRMILYVVSLETVHISVNILRYPKFKINLLSFREEINR